MGFYLRVLARVRGYIVICSLLFVRKSGTHASASRLRDKVWWCVLQGPWDEDRNGVLTRQRHRSFDLPCGHDLSNCI